MYICSHEKKPAAGRCTSEGCWQCNYCPRTTNHREHSLMHTDHEGIQVRASVPICQRVSVAYKIGPTFDSHALLAVSVNMYQSSVLHSAICQNEALITTAVYRCQFVS